MSRGFVKEGDQEDVPLVTPRAHLPAGVENYVTTTGLDALKTEREQLLSERNALTGIETNDVRVANNYINAKLILLEERIHSARLLDYDKNRQNEIGFGAKVTFSKSGIGNLFTYQIVGVDEANISKGKISFLSPLSKVLMNKKVGDSFTFNTPTGKQQITILTIE